MENLIKIIIAGLDNAGKTSILTALDKKYDFHKDIISLTPTIRVEYHATEFLRNKTVFWDMGGQKKYRELYENKQDIYFSGTDLILYVIDIQDRERFNTSLSYLDMILQNFLKYNIDIPLIITFHKFDPDLHDVENVILDVNYLRDTIMDKYSMFKILFQQTSIYNIISIVQLISYGLSIFDEKFFELSGLLEHYLEEFNCKSLIVFDKNGIIISEFYSSVIEPKIYIEFLESIKEHLFLLKRMQEEAYEADANFSTIGNELLSYLHKFEIGDQSFFASVIIQEKFKDAFLENFSEFLVDLRQILEPLILS
jgi:small GTP-binding protein